MEEKLCLVVFANLILGNILSGCPIPQKSSVMHLIVCLIKIIFCYCENNTVALKSFEKGKVYNLQKLSWSQNLGKILSK